MFSVIPCEFLEIAKRLFLEFTFAYSNALLVNELLLTVIGLNSLGISITLVIYPAFIFTDKIDPRYLVFELELIITILESSFSNACLITSAYKKALNDIWHLNRVHVSKEMSQAYRLLKKYFTSLKIFGFETGKKCQGWIVPPSWDVKRGILKDPKGKIYI